MESGKSSDLTAKIDFEILESMVFHRFPLLDDIGTGPDPRAAAEA